MRIVIAGSSGFLGGHLMPSLRANGHDIVRLVRRTPGRPDEIRWNPADTELDPAALAGADAVINLAGVNIADRRWTDEFKAQLRSSRVEATNTLATAIATLPAGQRPATLINASAVGWYHDTGDRAVTEDGPAGDGFFAELCRAWEAATEPAEHAGTRVVRIRTGFPLAADGGLLKPMLLQFKLFAGGRLGSGRQYVPWLSMPDWLGAVRFLLDRPDLAGPVNLTGPNPVTNAALSDAVGRLLHRPSFWPVPRAAIRVALGELGAEATVSLRVLPGVLTAAGFAFRHSTVESALRHAVRPEPESR